MVLAKNIDIENIYVQLQRLNNYYKDKILFQKLGVEEKELLAKNEKYKNKYKGKKCFILGNGPSINKIDFDNLENELVITVNEMFRHKNFSKLNSNFHFIADPAYLKLRKSNREDLEIIEKMNLLAINNTTLFFPLNGVNIIKRYNWNKRIDIHYFSSNLYFYDNYKEDINFTRYVPCFQAVIQWCIAFAVYMGCNEIYLLGCDATNIITDLTLFTKQDTELNYAYNLSPKAAESVKNKHRELGLEGTLYGYWRIVHLFSQLVVYCKRNQVRLYNCSEESILTCIPKRKIENVL